MAGYNVVEISGTKPDQSEQGIWASSNNSAILQQIYESARYEVADCKFSPFNSKKKDAVTVTDDIWEIRIHNLHDMDSEVFMKVVNRLLSAGWEPIKFELLSISSWSYYLRKRID